MSTHTKLFMAIAVAALGLLAFGAASTASSIITPANPNSYFEEGDAPLVIARTLPPLEIITFTEMPIADLAAPDARPFAVLNPTVAKTAQAVWVSFLSQYDPAQGWWLGQTQPLAAKTENGLPNVAFAILASIKYALPAGEVLVTTTKPSVAVTHYKLDLGSQEITLANGLAAWVSQPDEYSGGNLVTAADKALYFPNRVIWAQGDLLITVASPLPLERVQELAAEVVMK